MNPQEIENLKAKEILRAIQLINAIYKCEMEQQPIKTIETEIFKFKYCAN